MSKKAFKSNFSWGVSWTPPWLTFFIKGSIVEENCNPSLSKKLTLLISGIYGEISGLAPDQTRQGNKKKWLSSKLWIGEILNTNK